MLRCVQICLHHKPDTSGISTLLRYVHRTAEPDEKPEQRQGYRNARRKTITVTKYCLRRVLTSLRRWRSVGMICHGELGLRDLPIPLNSLAEHSAPPPASLATAYQVAATESKVWTPTEANSALAHLRVLIPPSSFQIKPIPAEGHASAIHLVARPRHLHVAPEFHLFLNVGGASMRSNLGIPFKRVRCTKAVGVGKKLTKCCGPKAISLLCKPFAQWRLCRLLEYVAPGATKLTERRF